MLVCVYNDMSENIAVFGPAEDSQIELGTRKPKSAIAAQTAESGFADSGNTALLLLGIEL